MGVVRGRIWLARGVGHSLDMVSVTSVSVSLHSAMGFSAGATPCPALCRDHSSFVVVARIGQSPILAWKRMGLLGCFRGVDRNDVSHAFIG